MKMNLSRAAVFGLAVLAVVSPAANAAEEAKTTSPWSVTSPNGQVRLIVQLADLGGQRDFPTGKRLYFRVEFGAEGQRTVMVADSPLGLKLSDRDFLDNLVFAAAQLPRTIEESYELLHGKKRQATNRGTHQTLVFHNAAGQPLELDLRAYDNGIAFRYRVPGKGEEQTLVNEATGFALPEGTKLWMAPADKVTKYTPAYETYYESGIAPGTSSPLEAGWTFPVLANLPQGPWALLTEADVGPTFCGTRLSNTAPAGVYRITFPLAEEGNGEGAVQPRSTLPWEMPWRVLMVGEGLGAIVESTLVMDLAPPVRVADTSWIKPGRVAWSWWSDPPSPQDGAKQKKFVDLAAEMGWEYMLVDANWDIMDNGNIHDVLRHAKEKGVGVLLWYNSGGAHNVVTEKPRDTLTLSPVRRFELELLKKWGVKGMKVDFFQSDEQNIMGLYHGIMQDAADFQIMVNFHGCTLPRGWERTWPNLMSMEAVRGSECYIFDKKYPEKSPVQNTILPFTRNVVGPMDFTPVAFSDNTYPHLTTAAHELALAVIFESGWLHFADKAEAYRNLPAEPKEFLKQVPVAWEETRFIAGYPGKFIALARRHGDTWYVAAINGQNEPRTLEIPTASWLPVGSYSITRIGEGTDPRSFACETGVVKAGATLNVKLAPRGGFVATLKPAAGK